MFIFAGYAGEGTLVMGNTIRTAEQKGYVFIDRSFHFKANGIVGSGYHAYRPEETWLPDLNLYEDDRNYYVVANLAGIGFKAIDLEYDDGQLVLSGYRPTPPPPRAYGELKLHHMEIDHGRFCRKMDLPPHVDADAIEAVYRAGLLFITIPKKS